MKWLIAGGSGQLGLALQAELNSRGIDFVAADSSELDIRKPLIVNQITDFLKPNIIVNAAAWTNVDAAESNEADAYSLNAIGPQNLAIAARNIGARFVHISTDYVFSGQCSKPWTVTDAHNPQSVYGKTKSEGEKLILGDYSEGSYIVRTAWLYSANRKNFAKTIAKLALRDENDIRVVNDQLGQPTFAGDLAKQVIDLALSNASVGIYHGTNSGQATWFKFAQEILKLAGANVSRVIPVSTSEYPSSAKRPVFSVLSHDDWSKTSIEPMRNWEIALADAMPSIISSIKAE
jgi:dTDP-4-dehydrorhamnose reductase